MMLEASLNFFLLPIKRDTPIPLVFFCKEFSMKKLLPPNYQLPSLSQLSIEQKIAQVLGFVVVPSQGWNHAETKELEAFVAQYGIGQIHLGAGNFRQTIDCIEYFQKLALEKNNIPIFFAADCEPGVPYNCGLGTELPWQMAIAATQNTEYAYWAGVITAKEARACGLDMIYGPDADLLTNAKNSIISVRSFGSDPAKTAEFIAQYVRGCQEQGVIATLKHFPGHGQVAEDSHLQLPVDTSDLAFIEKHHLPPFIAGIQAGAKAIMTTHIIFPAWDAALPATLSSAILTGLLRQKLGFSGIIATDSMRMNAISKYMPHPVEECTVAAIMAGCDLVLHPGKYEILMDVFNKALDQGRLTEKILDQAVSRVLAAKAYVLPYQLNADENMVEDFFQDKKRTDMAYQMALSSITLMPGSQEEALPNQAFDILSVLDDNFHRLSMPVSTQFVDTILAHRPQSRVYKIVENMPDAPWDEIIKNTQDTTRPMLIALFNNRHGLSDQLIARIAQLTQNRKVHSTVIFGRPYMAQVLPGQVKYCAYGAAIPSQKAAAAVVLGQHPAQGKLPVEWS